MHINYAVPHLHALGCYHHILHQHHITAFDSRVHWIDQRSGVNEQFGAGVPYQEIQSVNNNVNDDPSFVRSSLSCTTTCAVSPIDTYKMHDTGPEAHAGPSKSSARHIGTEREEAAALVIQKHYRGYRVRKDSKVPQLYVHPVSSPHVHMCGEG